MSLKGYVIKPITYRDAMRIVVENHYLHRKCPCSFAFGLFEPEPRDTGGLFHTEKLVGVICYGTPSSCTLRSGVCGGEESNNVIELTRLWICDSVGKNGESYLIGNTIPLVKKEIIVSYAEIQQGHVGTVYQATNWIYTGLSAKRKSWTVEGLDKHCQTLSDKYTASEIRQIYGDRFKMIDRPRKHRYVYFNAKGRRKKELISKLRYKIEPYPKKLG